MLSIEEKKEKRNIYQKRYKEKYPERVKESSQRSSKKWKKNHPEETKKYIKEYREKNREKLKEYGKERHLKIRMQVLNHYGGILPKCACCEEGHVEFLTIDHINGGGNKHRRETSKSGKKIGSHFYIWLIENNFPSGFRILCHNCNWVIGHYGYCPHNPKVRKTREV